MKKRLILPLIALTLTACQNTVEIYDEVNSIGNFQMSKNQSKLISLCYGFSEVQKYHKNLMNSPIKRAFLEDENGKEANYLDVELIKDPKSSSDESTLSNILPVLKITCKQAFHDSLIKKVKIELENRTLSFRMESFGLNYFTDTPKEGCPHLLDSYCPTNTLFWKGNSEYTHPWLDHMIDGNYVFFDFYNIIGSNELNLKIDDITILHTMSIKQASTNYGIVGKSENWNDVKNEIESNPENSYIKGWFTEIKSKDFKEVVPEDSLLFLKLDFTKETDQLTYSTIYYDITYNGTSYKLADQFLM